MSKATITIDFDVSLLREQLATLETINNFYDGTPEDKQTEEHLDGIENLLSDMTICGCRLTTCNFCNPTREGNMTTDTIANPDTMTSEITNSCICGWCPKCEMGTWGIGEPCEECGTEVEWLGECGGCWDDMHTDLDYLLDEWKERNGNVAYTAIYGTNMGWLHQAGHTEPFEATAKEVLEHMSINTEWKLIVTLTGKEMTMTRYSHDEYGAHFTLQPLTELERDE